MKKTRKILIALLLVTLMLVVAIPTAFAQDDNSVAQIGETYYETLAEAIAAGFIKPIEYYNLSIEEFVDKLATIDMPYAVLEQIRELAGMNDGR